MEITAKLNELRANQTPVRVAIERYQICLPLEPLSEAGSHDTHCFVTGSCSAAFLDHEVQTIKNVKLGGVETTVIFLK